MARASKTDSSSSAQDEGPKAPAELDEGPGSGPGVPAELDEGPGSGPGVPAEIDEIRLYKAH